MYQLRHQLEFRTPLMKRTLLGLGGFRETTKQT